MKEQNTAFAENAKWIWISEAPQKNTFARFTGSFAAGEAKITVRIAAETDYVFRVNGETAGFGQFAGYPDHKYYDELDVTRYCVPGENRYDITVRYEGVNSLTHIDDGAGVIFTVFADGEPVAYSNTETRGGYDGRYIQHQDRLITGQLGLTAGMCTEREYAAGPCVEVPRICTFQKRPVKKTVLSEPVRAVPVPGKENLYDLGQETAGYLYLRLKASVPGQVKVAYGEHITDGAVRYQIHSRDFSLDFDVEPGTHEFTQYFIRVAGRYLEVFAPTGVAVMEIGLIPALYPLAEKGTSLTGLDRQIYETSVRTLRLCMNLHYEDCPWREQALYVVDSRNQMLCGYYAFAETEFQRANLIFMTRGMRADGFFELTFPAVDTPAIPFFSVMYPVAVYEYVQHTGDTSILPEVMPAMRTLMENFRARIEENGLIAEFDPPFWNFYEWSEGNSGSIKRDGTYGEKVYHLILNCAYVYALERFLPLCEMTGTDFDIDLTALRAAIQSEFFDEATGIFHSSKRNWENCTALGNAMALCIGLGDDRTVDALKNGKLLPATLSMMGYVYDALLTVDSANRDFVLADIRKNYGHMLEAGATSFWETIRGEADFGGAGSLCHGWSAMPVYYYNRLM